MPSFFIYVFDTETRDRMLDAGYLLLKSDEPKAIFVFAATPELSFDFQGAKHLYSDELTF